MSIKFFGLVVLLISSHFLALQAVPEKNQAQLMGVNSIDNYTPCQLDMTGDCID